VDDTAGSTLALARTAAEAVRSLNHATRGEDGLAQPADACGLIGELSLAASRLPQLLGQAGRWLDRALDGGRLGTDDGADPAHAVGAAWSFLPDARGSAAALARALAEAQQQLTAVNGEPSRKEPRS
jgi:hypothetical protein